MVIPHAFLRSLLPLVGIVTAFFVALSSVQAAVLPDEDPSREWLGPEYADAVYSRFVLAHPETPLVIDTADLALFAGGKAKVIAANPLGAFLKGWKNSVKGGFTGRLVDGIHSTFDPQLALLIQTLEAGEPLDVGPSLEVAYQLVRWVDAQPEGSIYPDALLAEALRLTNGHVLAAWGMTWNYFRKNWKLAGVRNYGELRSKFASLTGERHLWEGGARYVVLPTDQHETGDATTVFEDGHKKRHKDFERRLELTVSKRGDEYSYLYHRLGVELLTMASAQIGGSSKLGWIIGSAGALGEVTKFSQTAGLDGEKKKRVRNDLAAARSGNRLFTLVSSKAKAPLRTTDLSPARYLRSNAALYDEAYRLEKGRPSHYFGSTTNPKFWGPSMSVEELKLRFEHARDYDFQIFSHVILASGVDGERLHRGLADYADAGAKDNELNGLLRDFVEYEVGTPKELDVPFDLDLEIESNQYFVDEEIVGQSKDDRFQFEEVFARVQRQVEKILGQVEARESNRPVILRVSAPRCAAALGGGN